MTGRISGAGCAREWDMIREPVVAGQFYPAVPKRLRAELEQMIPCEQGKVTVLGIVAPHAGYVYSGAVAGAVYGKVKIPETILLLGPNHHGCGAKAALYPPGQWETPLGGIHINEKLTSLICDFSALVLRDEEAHRFEHSLEVQVPFLQYLRPTATLVPLCLSLLEYEGCKALGKALAAAIRAYGSEVLMVASSDMTHYEPDAAARRKDTMALTELLALDPEGLYSVVRRNSITMCGVIPVTVMLFAARELGATQSTLVRYATSGDASGDLRQVVGYAAVMVQ